MKLNEVKERFKKGDFLIVEHQSKKIVYKIGAEDGKRGEIITLKQFEAIMAENSNNYIKKCVFGGTCRQDIYIYNAYNIEF